ncbi:hypothetical protein WN944_020596 [Citrus x changshan-huyou]|uniref:Uncharacterized protein n=1 Tax=Citrus x changshan-huyou TaxID=2935761 RepID=A0AAP0M0L6_9ROSI
MVPAAENRTKHQQQHHNHNHNLVYNYGGCGGSYSDSVVGLMSRIQQQQQQGYEYSSSDQGCLLGSDLDDVVVVSNNNNNNNPIPMAEDESRTNSLSEAEAGSSSKDNQEERDEGWLQLSIGSHTKTSHGLKHHDDEVEVDPTARRGRGRGRGGLIELDLLPGGGSSQEASALLGTASTAFHHHAPEFRGQRPLLMNMAAAAGATTSSFSSSSLFFQQQQQGGGGSSSFSTFPHYHHQEINWAFRPIPIPQNIALASSSSSSSSSSLMPFGSYFARPFQVHTGLDVAGPSSDFRIIDPPRRPHSGIWFMLLASQNQTKEPFLPQIPKCFLRIKDGRMTVRLLIKYLVNKLKLDSESEHVRDNIWSPRDAVTLLPETSTTDHVMVLHYARTASN